MTQMVDCFIEHRNRVFFLLNPPLKETGLIQ